MIKNKKERYCNFLKEKGYSTYTISAYSRALEKFGKAIADNVFTMIIPDDIESIAEKLSDKEYSMVNDNNGDIHAALMQYVKFLEEKEDEDKDIPETDKEVSKDIEKVEEAIEQKFPE
jgi:site-specific recombinase XerD